MSKRIFTKHVHLHDGFETKSFAPGDEVPEWAEDRITNPKVYEEIGNTVAKTEENPSGGGQNQTAAGDDLDGLNADALKELAGELGLPKTGSKAVLKAAIREKRAADAAEAAKASASGEPNGRAALEEALTAKGIEFEPENSDEELEALLEGA